MKEHLKIKLHKNADEVIFEKYLKNLNIEFEKIEYFEGYKIYKINKLDDEKAKEISKRSEISKILPMRRYFLDFKTRVIDKKIELNLPEKNETYPVVGVIDNGVSKISRISPWLYEDSKKYVKEKLSFTHGTFVAGVILKGNNYPNVKIYDGAIIPDFNVIHLEEDELILRLKKVIEEHSDIKVWNLSISIRYPVELDWISDFGIVLDYLQEKHDILILKSCGNGDFKAKERGVILEGADSLRALVIASCNKNQEISSFSLGGKDHKILSKPDIATYGGDVSYSEEGKIKVEGVSSFSPDGEIVSSFGTSFATARMTRIAGSIYSYKKAASTLFIKAFLIHNSIKPEKDLCNFGYFQEIENLEKNIEKLNVVEDEISENKKIMFKHKGKLLFTLISEVELDYHQENGYILSDIEIEVRCKGKILENRYGKYKKFTNIKKYEFDTGDDLKEVELLLNKREIDKNNLPIKFCLVWEK